MSVVLGHGHKIIRGDNKWLQQAREKEVVVHSLVKSLELIS